MSQHNTTPRQRTFAVTLQRKSCLNANQSARKAVAHIVDVDAKSAMAAAEKKREYQAFKAISAREA